MQISPKIRNKNTAWSADLKPRVTDTVISNGIYYVNVAGYNGALSDVSIWLPVGVNSSNGFEINKVAADITGADPFFNIDLSTAGIPTFPKSLVVYKDQPGDGSWVSVSPIDYDAKNKILRGMDNPADFPAEKIKILVN